MIEHNPNLPAEKTTGRPDPASRRTRLREFQAQLVERMQAAQTGAAGGSSRLGVLVGEHRWLLDLQEAGEIVSVGAIAKVPLTHDWFLGLSNVRGNLIGVIDFARFQGYAPTAIEKECRIVAFAPGLAINCGLLVTRVLGLRNAADMEQAETIRVEATQPYGAGRSYIDNDGHTWTEMNLAGLIQDPLFMQVGL